MPDDDDDDLYYYSDSDDPSDDSGGGEPEKTTEQNEGKQSMANENQIKETMPTADEIATAVMAKIAATLPPAPQINKEDPAELQLLKSLNRSNGETLIFARVLNKEGMGLHDKIVTFTIEGEQKSIKTDKDGNAVYPDFLVAQDRRHIIEVSAHTSGVRDIKKITIPYIEKMAD